MIDLGLLRPAAPGTRKLPDAAALAFAIQRPLVTSKGTRDIALIPRQAGKTTTAILRAFKVALNPRSERVTYITKTRKNGKRLFWRPLLEHATKLGLKVDKQHANHGDLTLRVDHDDGTYCLIEILGAHDQDQIELLRGTQYDLVIIDEAGFIRPSILELLLNEVLVPGCRRRQGAILMIGTPGPVKFGPFYDASISDKWQRFYWTAWDIIDDLIRIDPEFPRDAIDKEIADLGLKPTDARYVTEYLGKFFDGPDARRVWDYDPARNTPDIVLPRSAHDKGFEHWRFSWGIDLASSTDSDALVVLGWNTRDPERRIYEVDSWQAPGTELIDELEAVLQAKKLQWRPSAAMGDDQGHGAKKILNTLSPRLGILFQQKAGSNVEATVRLMNTDLRLGRYRVRPVASGEDAQKDVVRLQGGPGALAEDMQMEVWEVTKTGKRVISGERHSDLTAAARYAYLAAYHFRSTAGPRVITDPQEAADAAVDAYIAKQGSARKTRAEWRPVDPITARPSHCEWPDRRIGRPTQSFCPSTTRRRERRAVLSSRSLRPGRPCTSTALRSSRRMQRGSPSTRWRVFASSGSRRLPRSFAVASVRSRARSRLSSSPPRAIGTYPAPAGASAPSSTASSRWPAFTPRRARRSSEACSARTPSYSGKTIA